VGVGAGTVSVGGAMVAVGGISVLVAVAWGNGASVGAEVGAGVAAGLKLQAMASTTNSSSKEIRFIMNSTPFRFLVR
jgi:hypothetical protein